MKEIDECSCGGYGLKLYALEYRHGSPVMKVLQLVHTTDTDKTKLSCLVRVGGLSTTADKTRQFCLVSTQFPICNCSVSNISMTLENLETGNLCEFVLLRNWVETRQNCLVLSAVVFTLLTRTRQDSFVLSMSAV